MKLFSLISIAAMSSLAAVPHKFEAKTPARAEEVNANFDYLELGIKSKANQAGLDSVKASLPTLSQWSNLATQPQLKDSAKAIRNSLDNYAKTSDLVVYAKDTALSALGKRIQDSLSLIKSSLSTKAEKATSLTADTKGTLSLDTAARITFRSKSGPSDIMSFGGTSFGFIGYTGAVSTFFHATSGSNMELAVNSRGVETPIFTTSGSSITFPNTVYMTGTLNAPNIVATGIKSSNVADYVFDPNYQIMSLQEVESFTNANRHLPEVPSATEIERNGMDIAKMNLILLKKIEELTLHAIAQQKEIDALNSSVKSLQAQ